MRIGLIDCDGHNYPNLALMKISAWHKKQGDFVEWYEPLKGLIQKYDKVYCSKVFSFSSDYDSPIYADEIEKGGTGYCIEDVNGKEIFHKERDKNLPNEIEHIYPDYSIYPEYTKDTAYGFLTRGCPRGCDFCIVKDKEGLCSTKVADLSEFWDGQKNIVLLDPNILACREWKNLLQQLIDSKAKVNFNQGLDIRMITEEKAEMLSQIPISAIHFAYDRIEDRDLIEPKFKIFRQKSSVHPHHLQVYCLVGDRERKILDGDLHRIYWLRDNGYAPYIMIYEKYKLPKGHELLKLQRYVNNRFVFWACDSFDDYMRKEKYEK